MKALISVLISLTASAMLLAQDEEPSLDEKTRSIQFAAYGDDYFEGLKFDIGEERVVNLKFYPDRRTNPFQIVWSRREIEFYIEEEDPRSLKLIRKVIARADLRDVGERALLVFFVSDEGPLPYEVLVLNESDEAFGPGSVRFLNLTGIELKARFGNAPFDLPVGISDTLIFKIEEIEALPFRLLAENDDGTMTLVYSSGASADPQRGVLYVIKPPQTIDGRIVSLRQLL